MSTPAKIELKDIPTIALVGRVNVGKSTLFNRLIEENKALVSTIPGTTRTSNEGLVLWRGKNVRLIDTGGLTFDTNVPLEKQIIKQTEQAIVKADVIILAADAQVGILPQERQLAQMLRKIKDKPVILAANKVDSQKIEFNITDKEWLKLGLGEPYPISAANGRNLGNFLDYIFKVLSKQMKRPKTIKTKNEEVINIAIVGKPNVGKSSIFNKLIGEEKVIVSPMPHTTREPHDTLVAYDYSENGKRGTQLINFIDTAGLRRKAKVSGELERAGIQKSIETIEKSDIILMILDGSEPISSQDRQLGGLLEKHAKSVIILLNKWDMTKDNSDRFRNQVKNMVYGHFPHLDFAPLIFVSGLTGYRVHEIFPLLMKVWQARHTEISNVELENFLKKSVRKHKPVRGKGVRHPEIKGFKQVDINPPVFVVSIKHGTSLHSSYLSFLAKRLREHFDFLGAPVIIKMRKMKK